MENALEDFKRIRAQFVQRKVLKYEFELFTKFENHTRHVWGLYQQAIVGDVNVPKLNYMEIDEGEKSWMWRWINGNEKWHAWNKCRGLTKEEASEQYVEAVQKLKIDIQQLLINWKIEISNEPTAAMNNNINNIA
ncbi:ACB domain-containing protein [Caenorhabditis elegans]|uniref:ACB domain-containing protein n=1 Tax=Caenorhabditis elegans TaxID=6239 RepID=Q45EL0_CAEEL|nr:ACB domain-containing protein [Caenorhabditis elegans]CCD66806.2 ACB domain-containing protein [Caenorhabditis elegans]|eukprot:NP_001033359.2 Acyl-Coenzyme A Binding Protein [Caenorhabditis elegans]